MKIEDFQKRLSQGVLLADGAMGSMLYEMIGPQRAFEELNATEAEAVFRVHKAYLDAGAHLIETNSFGANRFKLLPLGLADRVVEFNHKAAKIAREAREAASGDVLIAGSIGPLGAARQVRRLEPAEVFDIFREQAAALEERGVDLFILETFADIEDLATAVGAVRSFSLLPIIAQLTFSEEGTTFDGIEPAEAVRRLSGLDVQVIGVNCTVGPQRILPVARQLVASAGKPVSAMPNAGFPQRMGDRVIYPKSSPEYFAQFAREAAAAGVSILGGCCGTTPEHIRAMGEVLRETGRQTQPVSVSAGGAREAAAGGDQAEARPAVKPREPESRMWRMLTGGQFVVSVEIDPPKGTSLERIFAQVDQLTESGDVHAIDINSGTLARVGMDALLVAGALEARGVETIPHLTTRDMNLIGLQAGLLGAWSVSGVRNVLAITGDPPSLGDHPETSGVYEIDSIGLVQLMARLNQGTDWAGKQLGGHTNFTIGVALNPVAENLDEEIRRFRAKIDAGAHFAMTQPLFDPAQWHAFLDRFGGKPPVPVLVGVWPLTSLRQAVRLNNEVPGIFIPEAVLKDLESAGNRARERGFAVARGVLDWARSEFAGAYLIPPFKRYEEALELLG
ncbi:MAG TPA: bifunctional homocysteine S-methyltransferase/methylenetetrahydrofolate reductase [Candidatus Dormibacteraeota bacterium]|nr:bifunctional homocysteine S-methyltransferase/methylenetetrahydrofolate reductase [Candidatus Dormibacteraeota bacterium]